MNSRLHLPAINVFTIIALVMFAISGFGTRLFAEELTVAMENIDLEGKKIYYWSPQTQRKAPLVVFSHDLGGCVENIKYLAQALAEDGFWVAAMNHKDSSCGSKKTKQQPEAPIAQQDKWDDKTYADRRDDINAMLDAMVNNELFLKHINFEHIGMVGHSLGGYVAMGMGGAWQSWKNPHIKAVLALSPYTTPFLTKNTIPDIRVPIMYQGGTRDTEVTPSLTKPDGVYHLTHPDKYMVILDGASHAAWTDKVTAFHPSINSYGVAFFDYHLKGNASAGKLMIEKLNDVSAIYYENAKGKSEEPKAAATSSDAKPKSKTRH